MCANCNKQHFNLDVSFERNFSLFILMYLSYHININVSEWTHFLIFKCFHKCGVFFKLFRLYLCNWDRCFELCLSNLANCFNKIKYELPSLKLLQHKMCASCNKQHFNPNVLKESNSYLFIFKYLNFNLNIYVYELTFFKYLSVS